MDDLKITITDDKYGVERQRKTEVRGEVNFGNAYSLDMDVAALEKLCECLFALFPNDLVKLDISYSVGNH